MKFISLKNWLLEKKAEAPTYGCVMLDTNIHDWEKNHIGGIDPNDVFIKPEDDSYGLEDNPHVTVIYGIHEDEVDPDIIINLIKEHLDEVTVEIDEIGVFENDEYDVVKYEVPVTKQLKKYRNLFLKNFPNTQSFPDYNPHITLAYVMPGTGRKYAKKLEEPFEVIFNKGVYSWHEYKDGELEKKRKEHVFKNDEEEYQL